MCIRDSTYTHTHTHTNRQTPARAERVFTLTVVAGCAVLTVNISDVIGTGSKRSRRTFHRHSSALYTVVASRTVMLVRNAAGVVAVVACCAVA